MPRFYFHFSDGKRTFTDAIGLELAGCVDVRNRVITQIRDLKRSQSEHRIQDWSGWKVIVIDAMGKQTPIMPLARRLLCRFLPKSWSALLKRSESALGHPLVLGQIRPEP